MLYGLSKSDIARIDEIRRFTGVDRHQEVCAGLLRLTNQIWRTNTSASRFVTDSMVATWIDNPALHADISDLLAEEDQYRLLAWYCCVRPFDSGCRMCSEPVDPILARMARELVRPSDNSGL